MKNLQAFTTFILCPVVLLALAQGFAENNTPEHTPVSNTHLNTPDAFLANQTSSAATQGENAKLQLVVIEFCPVFCFKSTQKIDLKRIVEELYAEQGIEVVHSSFPMARAFKEVLDGRYDGIINPDHPALQPLTRTEKSLYDMKACSYIRADSSWGIKTDPLMTSLRFGLVKEYNYRSYSKQLANIINLASRENRAEYIASFSQQDIRNFRKLLAGRIDVTVTSHAVASYLIEINQWQDRIKIGSCFNEPLPTYIWFNSNNVNFDYYKSIFDENIDRFKQQENYLKFIRRYRDSE